MFESGSVSLNKGGGVRIGGGVRSGNGFWCGGDLDANAIIIMGAAVVAQIASWGVVHGRGGFCVLEPEADFH